ncbi:hypothetical protein BaRGS_00037261 [Batillaria attramentaria]|uniref:G-protein coupled receptors family 1 profile domain-containing protein n=1 Tax=Batillaria attramentaria TaxID=370345 RepID=A0ABD0J968_9CAEN
MSTMATDKAIVDVTTMGLLTTNPMPTDNSSVNDTLYNITGNATEAGYLDAHDKDLAKVEIAVLSTILYFALFGNGVVLVVLRLRRQKLTRMQWFIVHLSLADIFVAIFHVLPQLIMDITVQFYGDDFLCRFVRYVNVVAMYASSYVLVMAAVDRYLSICHPLTNQTLSPKRIHLMILLAWGLSFLFSVPQIFIFRLENVSWVARATTCVTRPLPRAGEVQAYVTWIFLSVYALPLLVLTFCYTRICQVVWVSVAAKQKSNWRMLDRNKNKGVLWRISFRPSSSSSGSSSNNNSNSATSRLSPSDANGHVTREDAQSLRCLMSSSESKPRGHQRGMSKSKVKTVKLTLTVVLCYLFCWAPFFIVNMLTVWDPSIPFEGPVVTIIALLASLNSCTNPWIYLAFSDCSCKKADRRITRSWTRSTHMATSTYDSESRSRTSMYDLSRPSSREASPWTRDNVRTNSTC